MGGSLKIVRLWGIEIQVHWSFLLILVYGAFIFGAGPASPLVGAIYGIVVILLLFVCVVLHELGHALTAKYFNVNVPYITLLPIGGVAQLERMPRKPWHEFLIAIAGPAVNFVLAILLLPIALLVIGMTMRTGAINTAGDVMGMMQRPGLGNLLIYLTVVNVLLGVFNLLPAFPMDGGRILRALLAMNIPYVRATRIAVLVGRGMAVLFALWGIMGGGIFLLLIAFFVYIGGRGELEAVESRYVLKDFRARQALNQNVKVLYTTQQVNEAVDLIMTTYQADFPVYDLSHNFVGVLTRSLLVNALREGKGEQRIAEAMIPARDVPTLSPDANLADVWDCLMENRSRVVAIKEYGRFLGLLTLEDMSEVIQVMGAAKERGTEIPGRSSSAGLADAPTPETAIAEQTGPDIEPEEIDSERSRPS
jgi:Zn-dependent protease/predicted transcriptional regulator